MSGIPSPIEMPNPLPVMTKNFDLAWPQLMTPVGAGFIQTIDRGPDLWTAKYTTPPLSDATDQIFQSFLDQLNGSAFTFLGFDPRRTKPYNYTVNGSETITGSNFANSTLALANFTGSAVLTNGDYISFQFGDIWRLYRVMGGPFTASSGVFSAVKVVPRPVDTISSPITLRLTRACAEMKIIGAVQKDDTVTEFPKYQFTSAQFINRS